MASPLQYDRATEDPTASPLELTILMPCLNEAETISTCVGKAQSFLARAGIAGEVLIADNGSSDGSVVLAQREGARVIAVAERGYGAALRAGVAAARGRFVVMGDADDSYDFSGLDPFIAKLRARCDAISTSLFGKSSAELHWAHVLSRQDWRLPLRSARISPRRHLGSWPANFRNGTGERNGGPRRHRQSDHR